MLSLGDFATAEKTFREALGREPRGGRAYFCLAWSLDALGRTADAQDVRARAARAWQHADANLPQMEKLRTSTAAPAQS